MAPEPVPADPGGQGRDPVAEAAAAARSAESVRRLDEITRRLRVECPWDREQDERSIVPHTVEEAYELADAAAGGDDAKLLDELGDVLFQVHFLSLLMEERDAGDMSAVAEQMTEKLIRRHPHVFGEPGETEADTAGEVLSNWDQIKQEREGRSGLFADVPENLPALLHARKLQRRAVNRAPEGAELGVVGKDTPADSIQAATAALEQLRELADAGADGTPAADPAARDAVDRQLGEALFAIVDLSRRLRSDPELALRAASERFRSSAGEA